MAHFEMSVKIGDASGDDATLSINLYPEENRSITISISPTNYSAEKEMWETIIDLSPNQARFLKAALGAILEGMDSVATV